jgi:hypothetical protein
MITNKLYHDIYHYLYYEKGYDISESHINKLLYIFFVGVANLIYDNKDKDENYNCLFIANYSISRPRVFFMKLNHYDYYNDIIDISYEFINKTDPKYFIYKNYTYFNLDNDLIYSYFRVVAGDKYGMVFRDKECIHIIFKSILEILDNYDDRDDILNYIFHNEIYAKGDSFMKITISKGGIDLKTINSNEATVTIYTDQRTIDRIASDKATKKYREIYKKSEENKKDRINMYNSVLAAPIRKYSIDPFSKNLELENGILLEYVKDGYCMCKFNDAPLIISIQKLEEYMTNYINQKKRREI